MIQTLSLRPYQRETLDAVAAKFAEGVQRPAVVLPTGAGKTVCFAHQAVEFLRENPDERVLILVDTDELAVQTFKRVCSVAPHLRVGIVKARLNDVTADVIVGSMQTLRNPERRRQIRHVGLVVVDECEAATSKSYQGILKHFGCFDGPTKAVGYTATLIRSDGKSLFPTWQEVAIERDISWMIRERFLIVPRGKAVEVPDLDLRNVKATRTDFREEELGEALADSLAPELVAKAVLEHASDRKTLGFFPTVASAYVFAEAFDAAGIEARVVHGTLPTRERRDNLAWHRRGTVLINCMLLTKGYDDPEVDCIVMGRPTRSKRLYIQIVGRGLRVDPAREYDGQDCLLLDVVGANAIHDLRSIVDLSKRKLRPEDAHSGKSLTDLEDLLDAGPGVEPDQPDWYTGEVIIREFDPISRASKTVWIKTDEGSYFVPAGKDLYIFIMQYPEPGQWSVSWCTVRPGGRYALNTEGIPRPSANGRQVGMTERRGLPLDQAMVWAESLARDAGSVVNTSSRTAPWRRKPPSDALAALARKLGVEVGERRSGEVSDEITQIVGSRRIDPLVRVAQKR